MLVPVIALGSAILRIVTYSNGCLRPTVVGLFSAFELAGWALSTNMWYSLRTEGQTESAPEAGPALISFIFSWQLMVFLGGIACLLYVLCHLA